MTPDAAHLEALLFTSGDGVTKADLARLTGRPPEEITVLLEELRQSLRGHGLALVETVTHVQLTTSPEVAEWLAACVQVERTDLSAAAAETLALIAYKGPVHRAALDAIRGVDSRRMVQQLVARGLIRVVETRARSPYYAVTETFLAQLGITKVTDLPQFAILSNDQRLAQALANRNSDADSAVA